MRSICIILALHAACSFAPTFAASPEEDDPARRPSLMRREDKSQPPPLPIPASLEEEEHIPAKVQRQVYEKVVTVGSDGDVHVLADGEVDDADAIASDGKVAWWMGSDPEKIHKDTDGKVRVMIGEDGLVH
mmetsp:Transcript_90550/g.161293  ORF Transcript_90550/g.161293 Transcript_90550/m.161293 type:complete len:131 (-) Transcript_90550:41-433(-)|eukprot:CAMPEP_0197621596 /NCGR_PEP_ID=MMETSP1338-20131121/2139_1 /TAXON_ID=43686 ORGANISM="Pelagodinium beii, Strain RCC1491" /NCGR_SAMPLE_ID=MMETSP1338 /ASSEMBLY_ACC=CAM_ASM_000754 /LENGTH=130 /DNA_ID=CAMNT_0043191107 /DNA_START=63 /DNA_END=455 /DNA_ORIENTATION=+